MMPRTSAKLTHTPFYKKKTKSSNSLLFSLLIFFASSLAILSKQI